MNPSPQHHSARSSILSALLAPVRHRLRHFGLFVTLLLLVLLVNLFSACDKVKADAAKAQAWLNSPTGVTTLADLQTVANLANTIAGGKNAGKISNALSTVGLAVRTLQTGTAPDAASLQAAIQTYGGSSTVASTLAPVLHTAIQSAINYGVSPNTAMETVATKADAAAATVAATVNNP